MFEIGTPGSFYGEARRTADKFVVLKGALLSNSIVPSAPASVARYREMFAGFIENQRLTKDIPFSSPTAAATFLSGNSISGPRFWKVKGTDVTLGQWMKEDTTPPAQTDAHIAQVTAEATDVIDAAVTSTSPEK